MIQIALDLGLYVDSQLDQLHFQQHAGIEKRSVCCNLKREESECVERSVCAAC